MAHLAATEQITDEGAFPDEDLNRSATRGDILLLAQYMQNALARLEDIERKVSPPKPDFDTGWCEIGPESAIRHNLSSDRPIGDVEGLLRFPGITNGQILLPYAGTEGKVWMRPPSGGLITVINTTPRACETRIKGYFT
jgi:hypothetical protein